MLLLRHHAEVINKNCDRGILNMVFKSNFAGKFGTGRQKFDRTDNTALA